MDVKKHRYMRRVVCFLLTINRVLQNRLKQATSDWQRTKHCYNYTPDSREGKLEKWDLRGGAEMQRKDIKCMPICGSHRGRMYVTLLSWTFDYFTNVTFHFDSFFHTLVPHFQICTWDEWSNRNSSCREGCWSYQQVERSEHNLLDLNLELFLRVSIA